MPQRAATGSAGAKKARAPKAHQLPAQFPSGEVLHSTQPAKRKFQLGDVIGQGGFGLIYKASDVTEGPAIGEPQYVIKIEPLENGPLFCEFHFYQRAAKADMVNEWKTVKNLKYLAIPPFLGSGQHTKGGKQYRYLVMPRLSTDLHKIFVSARRSFSEKTTFSIALRMLDALEYIHDKGYAHADIKASNILLGHDGGQTDNNQVYLVDFGLAYRYNPDGQHKPYREDPKRAHDGTAEYASRDAHKGVAPSRRGDLEILGYCMLEWLSGHLPWDKHLENKDKIRDLKIKYMSDLPSLYKDCFGSKPCPDGLKKYLSVVSKLAYDEKPNYTQLRQFLKSGAGTNEWTLELPSGDTPAPARGIKRTSDATAGPSMPKVKKVSGSKSTPAVNGAGKSTPARVSPRGRPAIVNPSSSTGAAKRRTPSAGTGSARRKANGTTPKEKASAPTTKRRRKNVTTSETAVQTSPGFGLKG